MITPAHAGPCVTQAGLGIHRHDHTKCYAMIHLFIYRGGATSVYMQYMMLV